MPPKLVYGKRTAAKTATIAYAKFISPDKEEDAGGRRKTKNACDANKMGKQTGIEDAGVLVEGLGWLRIDGKELEGGLPELKKTRKNAVDGKKTGIDETRLNTTRRARKDGEDGVKEQPSVEAEKDDIAEELNALDINEDEEEPAKTCPERTKKGRSARQTPPASKRTKGKGTKRPRQTDEPERQAEPQANPATPVRVHKLKDGTLPQSKDLPEMLHHPPPDYSHVPQNPYAAYVSPLLSLQSYGKDITSFKQWSASLEPYFEVTKIAEASFSEVYRLSALGTEGGAMKESVLKLVPLRSPPDACLLNNPRPQRSCSKNAGASKEQEVQDEHAEWKSHVDDVYSEVKLLQNLNYIPGFTNFREITVLQGRPSTTFINAWKTWNKARPRGRKSEFPDPSKKVSYDDAQLWAVIEMQDAGTDVEKVMEKGGLITVWEIWDVFWGVCLSVAKAEEACRFEHRDLHLENICIRSSRSELEEDLVNPIIKDPLRRKFGFTGLETTVIDYTLSRADVTSSSSRRSSSMTIPSSPSASSPSIPSTSPEVAFLDLNKDAGLFEGDASEEYQYEIYRYMHGTVFHNDPLKYEPPEARKASEELRRSPRKTSQHIRFDDPETPRSSPRKHLVNKYFDPPDDIWKHFHPKTNLVWAHFILHQLLEHLKGNEPSNLSSKQIMRNVEISPEEKGKVVRKATKLYKVLERVVELLEPGRLAAKGSLGSVKELVVVAMEERWLRVGDVAGE